MTNIEAAKKLIELYAWYLQEYSDPDGGYSEAVAMGAAVLIYSKEVKPDVNTNWNSGSNLR
jgi:hypothetical protein